MDQNKEKVSLIIEGGAMRGVFCAGVISTLLRQEITCIMSSGSLPDRSMASIMSAGTLPAQKLRLLISPQIRLFQV